PRFGLPQAAHQIVEGYPVGLGKFEPGQEVERLPEVARVVEAAGDRGEIAEPERDVGGAVFEDRPALVLRELPPGGGLADGDERGAPARRTAEALLNGRQPLF